MGQAGAWKANFFLPQHLTLSLLCHPSGHGCQCFCCLSMEKCFPPQTLELCLCQDRSSSTPFRAQLSLNTFNLPWHPQGTGKKSFCFVCGCKAPSNSTFRPYGSPNHSLLQAKPHTRTQLLCDSLHQPRKVQGCKATTRTDCYDLIPQGWVLPGAES